AVPDDNVWLPYLGSALDAGVATLFSFEIIEACKTLIGPNPVQGIWLGAASDVIMRERGIEFVDGTAPGFAAVVGRAPDNATAVRIARELQEKNLYVFMSGGVGGVSFAEQLAAEGVQLGWETRLVPFGPDVSACIYSLGFASRAALSFGGVAPGDYERNLRYNKNRIFAFVLALDEVGDEKYAAAAGAINYGFPTIADTDIPEILPTGVCTYEHVVSNVPLDKIVERALEVRGCKIKITKVPIPVSYGPAFEGERVRKNEAHAEFGGNITTAFEFVTMAEMDEIEDGVIEIIGKDVDEVPEGSALPLAIWVQAAGRKMQQDFEPILERQIHHLINGAEGVWHIGQRDIVWTRISKTAFARGFRLRHYGEIIHAKFLGDYPAIVDKVKVTLITDEAEVRRRVDHARKIYIERNRRLESMTDDSVDTFYSCLLCQSFAPDHVCIITPERLGLCGAYNWLDGKAAFEIDETGPNQPVTKGRCLDPVCGIWEGVNEFVYQKSHKSLKSFTAYSIMDRPMTSCGCFEAIAAYVPECNGVMIVNREFQGDTPVGMSFSTLAGSVGGGAQTPGFMGIGKAFISSRKFLFAEGGLARVVWMPKELKLAVEEDFCKRAGEQGVPAILDMIADESIATDPHAIHEFMEKAGHPALNMPDMATLWTDEAEPETAPSVIEAPAEIKMADAVSGSDGNGGSPEPLALFTELKAEIKKELKTEITRDIVSQIVNSLQASFLGVKPVQQAHHEKPQPGAILKTSAPSASREVATVAAAVESAPVKTSTTHPSEPSRFASEKIGAVSKVQIPREPSSETIQLVTLGAAKAEGGTRGRTMAIGGQNCLSFHYFEGGAPNPPRLALEVFDTVSPKLAPLMREIWGDALNDPPRMAARAVDEFGADLIAVRLEGTHPEKGGKSSDEALALVKDVLAAVDVPLIITAHNHFDTANEALKKVASACAGERLLLNWVEGGNYRTIAGTALAYGHCVVAQSPIDINLAKQLNILLGNMDMPRDRIVIDPLAGALGYGLEYTYSVMERIRLTALGGDPALAFPMIVSVGQEAWKTKEVRASAPEFPQWGELSRRAVMWEAQTAMPFILAGADLLILNHPESLAIVRRNVRRLAQNKRAGS
ncbi:MAG: acetyl-CoA decarbonylase/synthase complex subunit alpha/beta, partial [Candidatus Sumerlaeota bacterium]|nr:acetyl-CoA decarbonylase/synthase complex subunit alpha/beta [Candidatus Sumerlaeota bacterium]